MTASAVSLAPGLASCPRYSILWVLKVPVLWFGTYRYLHPPAGVYRSVRKLCCPHLPSEDEIPPSSHDMPKIDSLRTVFGFNFVPFALNLDSLRNNERRMTEQKWP